jgi:hypothetical protein
MSWRNTSRVKLDKQTLQAEDSSSTLLSPSAPSRGRSTNLSVAGEFTDDFSEPLPPGGVIGSSVGGGITRKGIDRERVIGIDNGALRIQPLTKSRWRRAGLAYGPYTRRNGLAFGVSLLNGHNTSQTGALPETLTQRLRQWALGSETEKPLPRLARWVHSRQRKGAWRRLLAWTISGSRYLQTVAVDENLAVGWFPNEVPHNPVNEGNAVVMHALGPECGELWARVGRGILRSVRGVQNVQMYYVVILRDSGAAYYAASVPNVPGFEAYPMMTPVAVDHLSTDPTVYAGIHQSVLGQIGFRVDTRVYRTQVATLPEYDQWFGSASGADRLTGDGPLGVSSAAVGGAWTVWEGGYRRTVKGVTPVATENGAVLELPEPMGLLHTVVETDDQPVEGLALLFRVQDANNFWAFEVGTRQCSLLIKENGVLARFPATSAHYLAPNAANSVQVCDDGRAIRLNVNGELVYGTQFSDERLNDAAGVGLRYAGDVTSCVLRDFEAHPRRIRVPLDLGESWHPQGTRIVVRDDFESGPGELAGRSTPVGSRTWRRQVGQGEFLLTGSLALAVRGSVQEPCPGRTAYSIPWSNPRFADVSVQITPPGTRKGTGERGRGGVIFWQDAKNYITLSIFIDDWYGMSIAAFFYRDGYEELYDAVWSNIGKRVHWGMPYSFKVVFDSHRFTAFVNDEPVLYRALQDIYPDWDELLINETGLVANWEWGADTGTIFRHFVAKDLGC